MQVGIDASNLRHGGGVTHLLGLLTSVDPQEHGIDKITVFGQERTFRPAVPNRPEFEFVDDPLLQGSLPQRLYWQRRQLPRLAQQHCDLLLVPGGTFVGGGQPFVAICQNMLLFEPCEMRRYGLSWMRFRLQLLRIAQGRTFAQAAGLIFLSRYAAEGVRRVLPRLPALTEVIPHGVEERFRSEPRPQHQKQEGPFKLLYVSIVSPYKHPWNVAKAAALLRQRSWPVQLDLVGAAESAYLPRLLKVIAELDPEGRFLHYAGQEPFATVHRRYQEADIFIFASSCENMPNIVLEAMAAGLPIACSNRGPMPEMLGDAGAYFDPEKPEAIADAVEKLLREPALRERNAWQAYERAKQYSWRRCAQETFSFLTQVSQKHRQNRIACAA